MNKVSCLTVFAMLLFTACHKDELIALDNEIPIVKAESSFTVLFAGDITYAEGLSHDLTSDSVFPIQLQLDVYCPNNNSTNRPVYMFIHGGGFKGGIKHKP